MQEFSENRKVKYGYRYRTSNHDSISFISFDDLKEQTYVLLADVKKNHSKTKIEQKQFGNDGKLLSTNARKQEKN